MREPFLRKGSLMPLPKTFGVFFGGTSYKKFPRTPSRNFNAFYGETFLKKGSPKPLPKTFNAFLVGWNGDVFALIGDAGQRRESLRTDGTVLPQEFRRRRDPEFSTDVVLPRTLFQEAPTKPKAHKSQNSCQEPFFKVLERGAGEASFQEASPRKKIKIFFQIKPSQP